MKKKKMLSAGIVTAAMLATCSTAALAAPSVVVDGQTLALDQPPVLVDSRTLVPMRPIFEALGCEIKWYDDSQMVVAQKELRYISLTIGDTALYVNGDSIKLDVPAQIINGRTMVPLRAVSEALQATVDWDGDTETVTVQRPVQGAYSYTAQTYRENEDTVTVDMRYPQFTAGANDDQAAIAALNSQLAAASHSRAAAILQDLGQFSQDVHGELTATAQERFAVTYNKGAYTSVLFQTVQDTGGAHPMTVRNSAVYDMHTGKALALTDILKGDQQAIDQMILDGFTAQINAQPEAYFPDAADTLKQSVANHTYGYYLSKDGLTFYFQLYEIAPYAAGFSQYTLPFSQTDAFQLTV